MSFSLWSPLPRGRSPDGTCGKAPVYANATGGGEEMAPRPLCSFVVLR